MILSHGNEREDLDLQSKQTDSRFCRLPVMEADS